MKKRKNNSIKADYQAKELKNPFFYRSSRGAGVFWISLLAFVLLTILAWFLFISSFFNIAEIEINGLSRVNESEIKALVENQLEKDRLVFLSQRNIFLLKKQELSASILEAYNFSEIDIKRSLNKTLKINLSERPYAFIFQEGDDYYYASKDAYIIKDEEVSMEDMEKYFILENRSKLVRISDSSRLNLKSEYLNFVFRLNEALSYQNELKINKYIIEQELSSLILDFKDGPLVYFSLDRDPVEQFEDLSIVKKEKMENSFNNHNYIDMRYGDLIYIN